MVQLTRTYFEKADIHMKTSGPYRDTLRIVEGLKRIGWTDVYSISNLKKQADDFFSQDHIEATISKNQTESRKLINILKAKIELGNRERPFFNAIALEYIRMYAGYTNRMFGTHFWSEIVPDLLTEGYISETTPIYVANFHLIHKDFREAQDLLNEQGTFGLVCEDCSNESNPLWQATEAVSNILNANGDPNTNAAYLASLDQDNFMRCIFVKGTFVR